MGWRYFNIVMGATTFFMFVCRFFLFHLFESPKFLLSRGRQSEAVAVVHGIGEQGITIEGLCTDRPQRTRTENKRGCLRMF